MADAGRLFAEAVSFSDLIPLDVEASSDEVPERALQRLAARNCGLLRAVAVLEDAQIEREERIEMGAELQRIETKVDLLIELVSTAISIAQPPPAEVFTTISARGFCCVLPAGHVQQGGSAVFSLFLNAAAAQALQWPVTVLSADNEGEDQQRVCCEFLRMPNELKLQFERFVFRRHRRAIAQNRRA